MTQDKPITDVGSHQALRRGNERRVLEILRREGPASQAHIARRAGLARATVNNIVKALEAAGRVEIRAGATGRETTIALVASHGALIAIDLGHQRIHGTIVSFDTRTRLDEVVDLAREHDAGSDVETIAALVACLLDRAGGSPVMTSSASAWDSTRPSMPRRATSPHRRSSLAGRATTFDRH